MLRRALSLKTTLLFLLVSRTLNVERVSWSSQGASTARVPADVSRAVAEVSRRSTTRSPIGLLRSASSRKRCEGPRAPPRQSRRLDASSPARVRLDRGASRRPPANQLPILPCHKRLKDSSEGTAETRATIGGSWKRFSQLFCTIGRSMRTLGQRGTHSCTAHGKCGRSCNDKGLRAAWFPRPQARESGYMSVVWLGMAVCQKELGVPNGNLAKSRS